MKVYTLNHFAVIVSALLYMALSATWYGLFQAPWMEMTGITQEAAENAGVVPFIVGFVGALILFYALAFLFLRLRVTSAVTGMLTASLIWLAFVLTQVLTNDLFSLRPAALALINAGSVFVAMLAGGAILGAWKKVAKVVA